MDFSVAKRHPYLIGGSVFVGLIILYLALHKRSTASSPTSAGGGDAVLNGISNATMLANAQTNAQVEVAQIQGNVATNQIEAQLEAEQSRQDTALAIVGVQANRDLAVEMSKDQASVQMTTINANAATQISADQKNTLLGIANIQSDLATKQINSIHDIAATLGTQKQLGSKVVNLIAAMQGPQAIAANQPTSVATVNAGVAGGPTGFLKALNPAGLLSSFFGF